MPCVLVLAARSRRGRDDESSMLAGDVIDVREPDVPIGRLEVGQFQFIQIEDCDVSEARAMLGSWSNEPELTVINERPAGTYTCEVKAGRERAADGRGGIDQARAREVLAEWGADRIAASAAGLRFRVIPANRAVSRGEPGTIEDIRGHLVAALSRSLARSRWHLADLPEPAGDGRLQLSRAEMLSRRRDVSVDPDTRELPPKRSRRGRKA